MFTLRNNVHTPGASGRSADVTANLSQTSGSGSGAGAGSGSIVTQLTNSKIKKSSLLITIKSVLGF